MKERKMQDQMSGVKIQDLKMRDQKTMTGKWRTNCWKVCSEGNMRDCVVQKISCKTVTAGVYLNFLTKEISVVSGGGRVRGEDLNLSAIHVHCVNDKQYIKYLQTTT